MIRTVTITVRCPHCRKRFTGTWLINERRVLCIGCFKLFDRRAA